MLLLRIKAGRERALYLPAQNTSTFPVWSQHETNKHTERETERERRRGGGGGFLHLMLMERKIMQVGDKRGEEEGCQTRLELQRKKK